MLAEGLRQFVHLAKMVPEGITDSCLEGWAARQAFGLRRVCQKFRKIFAESPTSAKNKKVQDLKHRLLANGMEKKEPRQLSAEELGEFPPPDFDWASVRAKIEEMKQRRKSEAAESQASLQKGEQSGDRQEPEEKQKRPVPTPSRGKYSLPPYVAKALGEMKGKVPKPFATTGEGDEPEPAEGAVEESQKKGKVTAKAKAKGKAKTQKKKQKAQLTGPEVEENLKPVDGEEAKQHAEQRAPALALVHPPLDPQASEAAAAAEASSSYCPKAFNAARLEFIAARRRNGAAYKDACHAWMMSDERANFLSGLSEKELKRRRFI